MNYFSLPESTQKKNLGTLGHCDEYRAQTQTHTTVSLCWFTNTRTTFSRFYTETLFFSSYWEGSTAAAAAATPKDAYRRRVDFKLNWHCSMQVSRLVRLPHKSVSLLPEYSLCSAYSLSTVRSPTRHRHWIYEKMYSIIRNWIIIFSVIIKSNFYTKRTSSLLMKMSYDSLENIMTFIQSARWYASHQSSQLRHFLCFNHVVCLCSIMIALVTYRPCVVRIVARLICVVPSALMFVIIFYFSFISSFKDPLTARA